MAEARDPISVARRLARLFRIERNGRFARLSGADAARLLQRRGSLIDALLILAPPRRPELDDAYAELACEVDRALPAAGARVAALAAELRLRRAADAASGLRDGGALRLLGHG